MKKFKAKYIKTKYKYLALILVLASVFLILKSFQANNLINDINSKQADTLTNSWQFFNVTTWQIPNKNFPQNQNYITTSTTTFQNATQTSYMENIFFIQTKPEQNLIISSEKANSKDNQIINLSTNVRIKVIPQQSNAIKLLETEQLTYNILDKTITSNVFVSLQQPNTLITGYGLFANIATGNYEFKNNVKSKFLPQN